MSKMKLVSEIDYLPQPWSVFENSGKRAPCALECGDWSPLFPLGRLVGQAAPRRAARGIACATVRSEAVRLTKFDGDKSPRKSGDKSPHSKWPSCSCALLCHEHYAAADKTLFDFQAATNSPAWQIVNDDVMGGVSTSQFQVLTNGRGVQRHGVGWRTTAGSPPCARRPFARTSPVATPSSFVCAATVAATSLRRAAIAASTRHSIKSLSQRRRANGRSIGCAFKDFVPTFRGRMLSDEPPLDPAKVASVGFLISDTAGRCRSNWRWLGSRRQARAGK